MSAIKAIDISSARRRFDRLDELLSEGRTPVLYVKRGKRRVFAVVSVDYLESLLETIEILEDPKARAQLAGSLRDMRAGRLIAHDQVKQLIK